MNPGSKLGPYEILSSIGSGGMGEAWKAGDTRLGRTVAIKKVKDQHSERLKQEVIIIVGRSVWEVPIYRSRCSFHLSAL